MKSEINLKELVQEEKRLFDTYKNNRANQDKIKHLRRMADVIEQIDKLTKK